MAMVKCVIFCCLIINLLNLWLSMGRTCYMLNRGLQSLFIQGLQWQYNIALIHLTSQSRHSCSSTELRSLAFTSIAGHHNHRTTLEGAPVGLLLPCTRTAQLAAHEVGLIPKYWQVIYTVTTGPTGWVLCNLCLQHSPVRSVAAPCIIHRFLECNVTFQVKCTHRLDYSRTVWSFW